MTFGVEKIKMVFEKVLKISLFVSTEYTNVMDGQVDGRTDRQTDTRLSRTSVQGGAVA